MWVQIFWIFERDWITICHSSNKSDLNTDKPKDFWIGPNNGEKMRSNCSKILVIYHNFSGQHCILLYLFVNAPFKFGSNDDLNDELFD
jgi:hypothetical protein